MQNKPVPERLQWHKIYTIRQSRLPNQPKMHHSVHPGLQSPMPAIYDSGHCESESLEVQLLQVFAVIAFDILLFTVGYQHVLAAVVGN